MDDYIAHLKIILPELILACSMLSMTLLGVFAKAKYHKLFNYAIISILLTIIYVMVNIVGFEAKHAFNTFFYTNSFIVFAKSIILFGGIFFMLLHIGENFNKATMLSNFEFPIIILSALLGMMLMLSADNFLLLYLALELQSLSLYILASFERNSLKSNEAGLKYFVLSALASGLLLYGISLVYGFTGTTSFITLEELFIAGVTVETTAIAFIIGMIFIIIGFCFKISAVPFHMWTPDVYQGAPTVVTAFFATLPKVAAIGLLTRVLMEPFAGWLNEWRQVIIVASALSMCIGSLGAIRQVNIKRLLAYSSIGHIGFILIGVAAGNQEGLLSILFYTAVYVIMSLGAFALILMMKKNGEYIEDINHLKGLGNNNPIMAFLIATIMFSMMGLPPLAGFYAKLYVFKAAIEAELYILVVVGIIASVIAAYYYLKIIKFMYFDKSEIFFDKSSIKTAIVALVTVIFNLFYFLVPSSLIDLIFYAIAGM